MSNKSCVVLAAVLLCSGLPAQSQELPDGPGKDLVEQRCVLCHGLDRATSAKRAPAEWDGILRRMVFLGAPVSADEVKTITTYLGANFGAKQAMK